MLPGCGPHKVGDIPNPTVQNRDAQMAEPEDLPDARRPSEPDAVLDVRSTGLPTPQSDYARAELAVFYLGLLTLTEVVTIRVDPVWGIAGFAVLVVGLTVGALRTAKPSGLSPDGVGLIERRETNLRVALLLPPLIGIASLTLQRFGELGRSGAVVLPALVAAFATMRANGYRRHDAGVSLPRSWWSGLFNLIVAASGVGLGYLRFLTSGSGSSPPESVSVAALSAAILLAVGTGFTIEFVYRGILQRAATDLFGQLVGVGYVATLSTVPIIGQRSPLDTGLIFLVAVAFGTAVQLTRSILGVSIAHAIAIFCALVVFPAMAGSG
jgi:membrane protease YdiL (CAAX protease family)